MTKLDRLLKLIERPPCKVVNLGSGYGTLTELLLERGHQVDAVDISMNALKRLKSNSRLRTFQQAVPRTMLEDNRYDLVIAHDLMTDLDPRDYRLFMSEVQRLMHRKGEALLSTPLDYHTHNPIGVFFKWLDTEFEIQQIEVSYHKYRSFNKKWLMEWLEKGTRFLFPQSGISHVMVLVRKKNAGEGSWLQKSP